MKLSEAIRLGAMSTPHFRGNLRGPVAVGTFQASLFGRSEPITIYQEGTCAVGAAIEAAGIGVRDLRRDESTIALRAEIAAGSVRKVLDIPAAWVELLSRAGTCPCCIVDGLLVGQLIPHINDSHCWTREQIAEWVATLEAQQDPQQPLRVTELAEVV